MWEKDRKCGRKTEIGLGDVGERQKMWERDRNRFG